MIKKLFKIYLFALFVLLISSGRSQGFAAKTKKESWSKNWQTSKVFIENKGQFKLPAESELRSTVSYAYDEGSCKIFFTPKGIVYSFKEKKKIDNDEDEEKEERELLKKSKNLEEFIEREREEKIIKYKSDVVSVEWEGANPHVQIIAEGLASEYYSYSFIEGGVDKNVNYISGYKKITYKNLYPNIDVEYIFNATDGFKYSIILHPGADASLIKLKYSNRVKLKNNGEIHISTKFGDIIEHAPQTFYAINKTAIVASAFIKNGASLSFQLEGYDKSKTLIIDPWVQTPTINNSNGVWECESDAAGNVYVIGGDSPMKLLKYNSAGALQWTFATAYDTSNSNYAWLGTLATDLAGNSYVTCGSTASLTKVNSAGAQVYKVNGGSTDEYWSISFNCDQTKLIVAGTTGGGGIGVNLSGCIFDINTANGGVSNKKIVGAMQGFLINEGRSLTSSYNGRYYYLTLDTIGCIDQNFSACSTAKPIFAISSGYALSYKCENYRPPNGNSGIKSIRANKYFVYTSNGTTIQKRSLASGAILGSAAIPGGLSTSSGGRNQIGNSGIDIDTCGNVYVGSSNAVIKYDANLNQLASTALPFHVYDVAVSTSGNIIVSGATGIGTNTTRTGYVQSINMGACNPLTLVCCDATICPAGPFCTTDPSYTLTVATPGGTWSGAGVNASGIFNPATAGAGTHTIIYTLACGKDSIQIKVNTCATLTVCQSNGNITASGGSPGYTWQTATTYTDCSGCFGGMCNPFICPGVVTTSLTTIATNTTTIAAPATYPLRITDLSGNTYTVTSLASVPNCTTSACTTPTLSIASQTNVGCAGGSTGAATITATPAGTYTYTWQPGSLNGASQSGLAAGIYTVTASGGATCTNTISVNITQATTPTLTVNSSTVCSGTTSTLTVSGATTYSWSPATGLNSTTAATVTATPTTTTIYTVTGTSGTCSSTATSTVTVNTVPTATATGTTLVCVGQTISLGVTTAATSFTWNGPNTFTSNIQNPTIPNATAVNSGIYTVTVASNGCTAVSTLSVNVTNSTSVTITPAGPFCSGTAATNLNASVTGGTWSGTGITNTATGTFDPSVAGVGTYTITYTISGSCGSKDSTVITVNPGPTAIATTSTSLVCAGQPINLNVNTTAGATYSWSGPSSYTSSSQNPVIANSTISNSGIYTVTVSSGTCTAVDTVSVNVVSNPTITVNSATICAGNSATLTANGATTYTWTPATGLSSPTGSVVVATPVNTTTYIVTGSVGTCAATAGTSTVTVNSTPTVTINNASLCSSTTVTITVSGASTYSWTPATGLSSSTGSMVTTNPGAAINYTVIGTDINGCIGTTSLTVVNSPSITTSISSTSVTCNGLSNGNATVTAGGGSGSGYTYSWLPTGGTNSISSNIPAGTYTCTIKDGAGCTSSTTVSIAQPQTLSLSVTSGLICTGQSYTLNAIVSGGTSPYSYNWNNGASTTNPYVVTPTSSANYTVVVTDANGCQPVVDNSVIVGVRPPLQVTVGNAAICAGNTTTLTASASGGNGNYIYSWSPSGLFGSSIVDSPASTTVYTVTVSDGCTTVSATDTGIVNVTPPPVIPPPAPASGCAPICINFTNPTGLVNWNWNFGDGVSSSDPNPQHCYTTAGSFNIALSYTTNIGCASTVTYSHVVNIYPVPVALFSASPNPTDIFSPQVNFNNQSVNSNSWQWTFGDGSSSSTQNPTHTYGQVGFYPVMLIATSQNGCKDTLVEEVIINDIYTFYAPNAFTPDEAMNEKFLPIGEGWNNETFKMWIFDRWGNNIFKTQDPNKGWDGRVHGSVVQQDVYVWKVQLNDIFGKAHQYNGTVTIIR
jgi:gliding motility-associated-like protein